MKYEKVIRDGKVAVLVSPDFGAGWRSWADEGEADALTFDSRIVDALERGEKELEKFVAGLGYQSYLGGARDLTIEWVPVGTAFRIHEYDGSETIETRDLLDWVIA